MIAWKILPTDSHAFVLMLQGVVRRIQWYLKMSTNTWQYSLLSLLSYCTVLLLEK